VLEDDVWVFYLLVEGVFVLDYRVGMFCCEWVVVGLWIW